MQEFVYDGFLYEKRLLFPLFREMFPANKPLPPSPLSEKSSWKSKSNASEASAPAIAIRLQSPSGTFNFSFFWTFLLLEADAGAYKHVGC